MVFESYEIHFFVLTFVSRSLSLMILMLNMLSFTCFPLRIPLLAVENDYKEGYLSASQTHYCHGPYMESLLLHMLF